MGRLCEVHGSGALTPGSGRHRTGATPIIATVRPLPWGPLGKGARTTGVIRGDGGEPRAWLLKTCASHVQVARRFLNQTHSKKKKKSYSSSISTSIYAVIRSCHSRGWRTYTAAAFRWMERTHTASCTAGCKASPARDSASVWRTVDISERRPAQVTAVALHDSARFSTSLP